MEFSISEDQAAIADLACQVFEDKVTHEYLRDQAQPDEPQSDEHLNNELWQTLAKAGLLGVAVSPSCGGSGLGVLELGAVLEAQGRYLAPIPLLETYLATLTLQQFASEDIQKEILPKLVSGESVLALSMDGDHARAERSDNQWLLNGNYPWVPLAACASTILLVAQSEDGPEVFLLPAATEGCKTELGQNTVLHQGYQLSLNQVRLRDEDRLTASIGGEGILEWMCQRFWALQAALQLGALEEALQRTADYTLERKQFGKPIASFQAVSHRAANGYIDIEVLRSVYWQAAWRLSAGKDAAQESRLAKWWLAEAGHRVSHSVQHLHGGIGSDLDYPIHRYFLWAKHQEFSGGNAAQVLAQQGAILAGGSVHE